MFCVCRPRDGRFAGHHIRWPVAKRRFAAEEGVEPRRPPNTSGHTTMCTIAGMADKVTLSLNPDTLARARAAADQAGMSLSAWMDRAARRETLREAGRRQDDWLAANPDVREQLDGFDRLADKLESGWSDLADAA